MKKITVLGAAGFIGSNLTEYLESCEYECVTPERDSSFRGNLGDVIYCIGVTADFRKRPWDTVEAHVCKLLELLRTNNFESLLYLSSTRVYSNMPLNDDAKESSVISIDMLDPSNIFNLSKLMGERACLTHRNPKVRVARVSNVYGGDYYSENFLPSLIRDALNKGSITLHTALDSEKDYIAIGDVVKLLKDIAIQGKKRIYNIASGKNISHEDITKLIRCETGSTIEVIRNAPRTGFPKISIEQIKGEFSFVPYSFKKGFSEMIEEFKSNIGEMRK